MWHQLASQIAEIVRKLAGRIDSVQASGIIHRDIKPASVILNKNGEPRLMNFGLARMELSKEKLTQDGSPRISFCHNEGVPHVGYTAARTAPLTVIDGEC